MTNVLVCGGGSGGHLYPALAVLEALRGQAGVGRVGFVGTRRPLDAQVFGPHPEIAFFRLHARHLRGGWWARLLGLGALGLGFAQSLCALARLRPGLVLGTGGYSSVPPLLAALQLGIPTAVLEPNTRPGLANRLLGPHVDRIFCHPDTELPFAHPNVTRTGVPLRAGLSQVRRTPALYARWGLDPEKPTLLVLGGSLGATALTRAALALARACGEVQIVLSLGAHQSHTLQRVRRAARGLPHLHCLPYIARMDEALALADLALCRGGALTLAELSACGVPAIVVPWEGAAESHQLHNARAHAQQGAGLLLRERALDSRTVLAAVRWALLPQRLDALRRASLALGRQHRQASAHIAKEVEPYLDGTVSLHRHRRRRDERAGQGVLATAPSAARVQH